MASLIEKTPAAGLAPVTVQGAVLDELPPARITSVAPLRGKERAVQAALKALGLGLPAPNRAVAGAAGACLWTGRGQAFLIGPAPEGLSGIAALTDQSDGWAALRLEGPAAEAVLARLAPIDLRAAVFPPGHVARTALNHMNAILHRSGPVAFDLYVFRSMAATAVHEIGEAMRGVAARG